ncbi:MAG: hypothetical protein LBU32_17065 [Clostridiales bacterium]|jgi:uncharacterized membrane protein|nr:hypothetical protein [Clostridiales bacterium]
MNDKSVFGLDEKISALLAYLLGFFSGIFYLIMEKENKFVRFHALQSTVWFLITSAASFLLNILSGVPVLGFLFGILLTLVGIVTFASWIYLMYMAFKGVSFKLPILGEAVWNHIEGTNK